MTDPRHRPTNYARDIAATLEQLRTAAETRHSDEATARTATATASTRLEEIRDLLATLVEAEEEQATSLAAIDLKLGAIDTTLAAMTTAIEGIGAI